MNYGTWILAVLSLGVPAWCYRVGKDRLPLAGVDRSASESEKPGDPTGYGVFFARPYTRYGLKEIFE